MNAIATILILSALVLGASPPSSPPSSPPAQVTVTGIQARLFYQSTGTFSRNVLSDSLFSLWNTIIGEGSAESPSNATFVTVEVTGPARAYADDSVRLRAVAKGRVLVNRAAGLSQFSSSGKQFIGFWIYDTGCAAIDLSATITGQTQAFQSRIPFECGE